MGVGGSGDVHSDTRLPAAGMPAAIEVTSKGLLRRGNSGTCGGDVGGGGSEEEVVEKRAIADVFRKVDLDASGHVSEEELLEGVSAHALGNGNVLLFLCIPSSIMLLNWLHQGNAH